MDWGVLHLPDRCKELPQAAPGQVLAEDGLAPARVTRAPSGGAGRSRGSAVITLRFRSVLRASCKMLFGGMSWRLCYGFWYIRYCWLVGICLVLVLLVWICSVHCSVQTSRDVPTRTFEYGFPEISGHPIPEVLLPPKASYVRVWAGSFLMRTTGDEFDLS